MADCAVKKFFGKKDKNDKSLEKDGLEKLISRKQSGQTH
jgi:hypothetical protein